MGDFLEFVKEMIPTIGFAQTLIFVVVIGIGGLAFRISNRTTTMLKDVMDKQEEQIESTLRTTESAICEIKEMTILTVKEVASLSGQVSGIVDIVKSLLGERLDDNKKGGGSV